MDDDNMSLWAQKIALLRHLCNKVPEGKKFDIIAVHDVVVAELVTRGTQQSIGNYCTVMLGRLIEEGLVTCDGPDLAGYQITQEGRILIRELSPKPT
jgi:hypothetical protein